MDYKQFRREYPEVVSNLDATRNGFFLRLKIQRMGCEVTQLISRDGRVLLEVSVGEERYYIGPDYHLLGRVKI